MDQSVVHPLILLLLHLILPFQIQMSTWKLLLESKSGTMDHWRLQRDLDFFYCMTWLLIFFWWNPFKVTKRKHFLDRPRSSKLERIPSFSDDPQWPEGFRSPKNTIREQDEKEKRPENLLSFVSQPTWTFFCGWNKAYRESGPKWFHGKVRLWKSAPFKFRLLCRVLLNGLKWFHPPLSTAKRIWPQLCETNQPLRLLAEI